MLCSSVALWWAPLQSLEPPGQGLLRPRFFHAIDQRVHLLVVTVKEGAGREVSYRSSHNAATRLPKSALRFGA
jgi:hypothetical protein